MSTSRCAIPEGTMNNTLQLLSIAAGILTIVVAGILAYRQSAITWQHVVVFSLGGVLAGISSVQMQWGAGTGSIGINSVHELAGATKQASDASAQQAEALAALNKRVDQLAETTQTLLAAQGKPAAQV